MSDHDRESHIENPYVSNNLEDINDESGRINRKNRWYIIFGIIAVTSIVIRLLMHYRFDKNALLYVGIPSLIAIGLMQIERPNSDGNWRRKFANLVLISLIIMLGSSIILFEGFLCVVMFMPIYFGVILVVFILKYLTERYKNKKSSKLYSHVLPLILLVSAFEGTHPNLSITRQNHVEVTRIINASISEIKQQLVQPINLQKDRHWFLELFPMPHKVDGMSLNEGDVHKIHFRYHRWFVTNTHEGSMQMKIEEVGEQEVKTQFIGDTSYIANYLKLDKTELKLTKIDNETTQITFSIHYERLLDPAWYFDPLQKYGVTKTAEFIIAEVMTPDETF